MVRITMNRYRYRPYYEYTGPSLAQPFREELSPEDVEYNLACFFDDVDRYFVEGTAEFNRVSDCIEITTNLSESECYERVKQCLNSLDLYAQKIKHAT